MVHRQVSTQPQNQRLHHDPEGFGDVSDVAAVVTGKRLQQQDFLLTQRPAIDQAVEHAHRLDHFGVTQVFRGVEGCCGVFLVGFGDRGAGDLLVGVCQEDQDNGATNGHPAVPRVKHKHDRQIDRQPRGIEKGEQAVAGHELTQRGEVIQRLSRGVHPATGQCNLEAGTVNITAQKDIKFGTDSNHDSRTNPLQQPRGDGEYDHDNGQHGQRRHTAAGEYPSIYLQHIEGGNQHQGVDKQAENADRYEAAPT